MGTFAIIIVWNIFFSNNIVLTSLVYWGSWFWYSIWQTDPLIHDVNERSDMQQHRGLATHGL